MFLTLLRPPSRLYPGKKSCWGALVAEIEMQMKVAAEGKYNLSENV
jgi:hypothetical protein